MRKFGLYLAAALLLAACNDNLKEETSSGDSSAKENAMISAPASDMRDTGVTSWKAVITPGVNNKGGRLMVTGRVHVKANEDDVTLTSSRAKATPGTLALTLSREPMTTGGKVTPVIYEELLDKAGKYKKVTIMYQNKPVAVIDKIEGSK